jgi:hypothetical protein
MGEHADPGMPAADPCEALDGPGRDIRLVDVEATHAAGAGGGSTDCQNKSMLLQMSADAT